MNTRLILIRHGITDGNMLGQFLGKTDVELSFQGRRQAKSTNKWLNSNEKIDVIYSSSLRRAISTAEMINNKGIIEHIKAPALNEMDFGMWEGKRHVDIMQSNFKEYVLWETTPHLHRIPGGESIHSLHQRLKKQLDELLSIHYGKNICIVTHGVCLKVLIAHICGFKFNELNLVDWYDNASITIVEHKNGQFNLKLNNYTGHLSEDMKSTSYPNISELLKVKFHTSFKSRVESTSSVT